MNASAVRSCPKSRSQRSTLGFTLVELLVVIAIIGILIGLLLAAVQAAREAARRAHCANNMKQIGLAMHLYHDVHKCFPPGGIWESVLTYVGNAHDRTNWAISLLPFLEESALHDQYNHEVDNTDPLNAFVREQYVAVYTCPSDVKPSKGDLALPAWGIGFHLKVPYQYGSYRAVSGRVEPPYSERDGTWGNYEGWREMLGDGRDWRGMYHIICPGLTQCERPASIRDGLSNTLAAGERHRPKFAFATFAGIPKTPGTLWASTAFNSRSDVFPFSETLRVLRWEDCHAVLAPEDTPCQNGPWASYHPGVIVWLIGDGSVRSISTNVDMRVLCRMASVSDGELTRLP